MVGTVTFCPCHPLSRSVTQELHSIAEAPDREAIDRLAPEDVILVTREGTPAGFFLPWDTPELPVEVRREVFLRLSEQVGAQLAGAGASESDVLDDFAATRRSR